MASQTQKKRFDYPAAIRIICEDMCHRLPVFQHIDFSKIGISICQTRIKGEYGVYASVTPLRFEHGKKAFFTKGSWWTIPTVFDSKKNPLLYIYSIYLPRFQDLTIMKKLNTLIHELYHIGQKFDGDIRRFDGRCYAHGSSREKYDKTVDQFVQQWLTTDPPPEIWNFLKHDFSGLQKEFGSIYGSVYSKIRLIRISEEKAQELLNKKD